MGTVPGMSLCSSECFIQLRRLARRSLPFAVLAIVLASGMLLWSVVRHRSRVQRGEVLSQPGRTRTRIAPLP